MASTGAGDRDARAQSQKLDALSTLAGEIAQDFNSVLVGILANSDMALKSLASPSISAVGTAREHIEQIETAAREAADLAKKLLAFSGKTKLTAQPRDVAQLLQEMAPLLRGIVPSAIQIEFNLTAQLPLVEADAAQIRQLMEHLLVNAVDAIGGGEGRISVGTGIIELDSKQHEGFLPDALPAGRYIYITVSDSGCGMDGATRQHIFDPFFTTKSSGRGLGLATVLGILHGHRGALRVESRPQKGTTFQIYFPCSPSKASGLLPPSYSPYSPQGTATTTILVVDDDATVRRVTSKILESAGYRVLRASDGIEALAQLREHSNEIALVFLDMRMPRMGGSEVFQEIRRMQPDLPIILSSGYDPHEDVDRLTADAATVFLQKPYSPSDLTAKVNLLLDSAPEP